MQTYQPPWRKHCREVLRFHGFFQTEMPVGMTTRTAVMTEQENVDVCCFLEDGTIQVVRRADFAPEVQGHGTSSELLSQRTGNCCPTLVKRGILIKRETGREYVLRDLFECLLDKAVFTIHGYRIHLVDCDAATRKYAIKSKAATDFQHGRARMQMQGEARH